jgi:hypothetical protein
MVSADVRRSTDSRPNPPIMLLSRSCPESANKFSEILNLLLTSPSFLSPEPSRFRQITKPLMTSTDEPTLQIIRSGHSGAANIRARSGGDVVAGGQQTLATPTTIKAAGVTASEEARESNFGPQFLASRRRGSDRRPVCESEARLTGLMNHRIRGPSAAPPRLVFLNHFGLLPIFRPELSRASKFGSIAS